MSVLHYNIRVSGHVQGVGYRYASIRKARGFGIKGFVKNEPDGSVYIEAEADKQQLDKFLDWCRIGPPHGRVDAIEITQSEVRSITGFDVRY